jgi:hypothetical protein
VRRETTIPSITTYAQTKRRHTLLVLFFSEDGFLEDFSKELILILCISIVVGFSFVGCSESGCLEDFSEESDLFFCVSVVIGLSFNAWGTSRDELALRARSEALTGEPTLGEEGFELGLL